ncbi:phosphotransferase [Paenibacillus sp. sptzw28]|uniref:phosphotransferase n=1 Tax=Paenibacillus sp. sptzw28 TaxID=715179 RepID=UPI001C6F5406|nr:phosphotransferase [Paenibacillus sp. sptzw28]QYR19037.1 phosphotransferase [Paenibacillus sp. sptzw28]
MAITAGGDFAAFLDQYNLAAAWRAVEEESGMNNTTRMVYSGDNKYVLRVYDNHRDAQIVRIEHLVLEGLQALKLPFKVPQPVENNRNSSITVSPDGKLAALFRFIEGDRPSPKNPEHVAGLGRAAGLLSHALNGVRPDVIPIYKPYYEFDKTHGAVTDEAIRVMAAESELLSGRTGQLEQLLRLRGQLLDLKPRIAALPHQWIHGDIVFTNSLCEGDRIVGMLDFEFSTVDVRVMELAVVLGEFPEAEEGTALERTALFCRGFGSAVKLTIDEIALLPELIKLRMMDVFLHFAGRYAEKLDPEQVWDGQIVRASYVCEWINRNLDKLEPMFRQYLL